ncbi:MAG: hypothetical protein L0Z53_22215 [Acidobacteriales bacterium]|nr:hypothetical protein [Terriglobales bacterium]
MDRQASSEQGVFDAETIPCGFADRDCNSTVQQHKQERDAEWINIKLPEFEQTARIEECQRRQRFANRFKVQSVLHFLGIQALALAITATGATTGEYWGGLLALLGMWPALNWFYWDLGDPGSASCLYVLAWKSLTTVQFVLSLHAATTALMLLSWKLGVLAFTGFVVAWNLEHKRPRECHGQEDDARRRWLDKVDGG